MRQTFTQLLIASSLALSLGACSHLPAPNNAKTTSAEIQNASPALAHALKTKEASEQSDLAYEIVKSLTVEVGPRIPGSQGDKRAVAWAEEKFNELGFDKVYKQPVRVRNWERGFADARVSAPFPQALVITALGGSVATPEEGLEEKVVMFDSLDSLTQASKASVEGNIVFLNTRMERDRAGRFYGKVVPNRVRGAVEAAKLGAKAVIIRSVGTDNSRFAHTGVMRYEEGVEKIPAGAISTADADNLEAMFSSDEDVVLSINMQAKDAGWQTSYNVIGEFTGSEKPEEVVLISAHLDSWDEGTGALDDGAGVGIVSAAAKIIKDTIGQPKRTIRVVLYAAEEIGLVGAYQYVRSNRDDLQNIIFAAESDFGAGKIYQLDTRFDEAVRNNPKDLYAMLASMGVELGNNTTNGGPDVSMLPNYGVPVIALKQDGTYYFDYHHTPNDTLDKIDLDDIRQNQTVWAVITAYMANSDFDPRPAPKKQ
ncbi:M20/M25/M40 family metallo-hydrolase [Glaciecola sp. MH2013]|uniref:M20/M25/M40 family metallo-hydrolase n=1 Tax=Glaciecola sp. MH2013 TaxID=2785524 RepID=UPI0018A0423B|nr:M20/M25/M40 family metallo-hydrolase [Glaciecola sp. MH2013]MBF7073204.1 M20/M25/M40 family metallo-hydrolase [Glaciecola sp. MH2013]